MDSSKSFMTACATHLYGFIEAHTQLKAADGGTLLPDIYGNLASVSWEELLKEFIPQAF